MTKDQLIKRLQDLEVEKRELLAEYNRVCKAEWLQMNEPEKCRSQREPGARSNMFDHVQIRFKGKVI